LALDSSGQPHISYKDGYYLAYAHRTRTAWAFDIVDTHIQCGEGNSIAMDNQNRPHITYCLGYDETGMKYAFKNNDGWKIEALDPGGRESTSLLLDEQQNPHVAYVTWSGVKYMFRDEQDWHTELIDPDGWLTNSIAISLRPDGNPCVLYRGFESPGLKYAYRTTSEWHTETVIGEYETGYYSALDTDHVGNPRVCFRYGYPMSDLMYATADHTRLFQVWGGVNDGMICLRWSPVPNAAEYLVYGADMTIQARSTTGIGPFLSLGKLPRAHTKWTDLMPGHDAGDFCRAYRVVAVDAAGSDLERSSLVGVSRVELIVP
jgi:hypothetical protein